MKRNSCTKLHSMRRKLSLWVGLEIASSLTATLDFQQYDSVLIKLQPFSPKINAVCDSDELIFNSFSSTLKEQTTVQQNFCERESEGGEENEWPSWGLVTYLSKAETNYFVLRPQKDHFAISHSDHSLLAPHSKGLVIHDYFSILWLKVEKSMFTWYLPHI